MDLSHLSPSDIAALRAQLGIQGPSDGRSPFRSRQLHNLNLKPTATDPRPTFFWSAEAPRDEAFPETPSGARLLFHQGTGQEITVHSDEEEASYGADWGRVAPRPVTVDPLAAIQTAMEALSVEDRALLIESQKQDRLAALKAKLANLEPGQVDALIAAVETTAVEPKKGKKIA